jgi:recombinational DNA repair protein (RecF pathway)
MILASPAALVSALEAIELAATLAPRGATREELFDLALRSCERALHDLEAEPDATRERALGTATIAALKALREGAARA